MSASHYSIALIPARWATRWDRGPIGSELQRLAPVGPHPGNTVSLFGNRLPSRRIWHWSRCIATLAERKSQV